MGFLRFRLDWLEELGQGIFGDGLLVGAVFGLGVLNSLSGTILGLL